MNQWKSAHAVMTQARTLADGAPDVDPAILSLGIPILGICYGAQLLSQALGGKVERTGGGEYGRTEIRVSASVVSRYCDR